MTTRNKRQNKLYVIDHYINGIVKQTILLNEPKKYIIAKFKRDQLANTTHRSGKLILRSI